MIVGGYSMHLYCDDPHHAERHPHKITSIDADISGPNERHCMKQARNLGWKFEADKCFCPLCNKINKRLTRKPYTFKRP